MQFNQRRAGNVSGHPVYAFSDNAKDNFNQLAMAHSERHKLGITFLAHERGIPGLAPGNLLFVSEKRLGFGKHDASNIAQRFSDSLLDMFREDMDEQEERLRLSASPAERECLHKRLRLQRRKGEACHHIRRLTMDPSTVPADIYPLRSLLRTSPRGSFALSCGCTALFCIQMTRCFW